MEELTGDLYTSRKNTCLVQLLLSAKVRVNLQDPRYKIDDPALVLENGVKIHGTDRIVRYVFSRIEMLNLRFIDYSYSF